MRPDAVDGVSYPPLSLAVEHFLQQPRFMPSTRTVYGTTLRKMVRELADPRLDELTSSHLRLWFDTMYGDRAANTRYRVLSTIHSAVNYWNIRYGLSLSLDLPTPVIKEDNTRALTRGEVEWLLRRGTNLRERCLWSMLYSTAARVSEVLALDVPDLDRLRKRAPIISKGGNTDWVWWDERTSRLLGQYLRDRTTGPVFLTRQGTRLGYDQAAEDFKKASNGRTLHVLRHSRLTHLAEAGASTPVLLAKSRHKSVESLVRYARPSHEYVQKWESDHE